MALIENPQFVIIDLYTQCYRYVFFSISSNNQLNGVGINLNLWSDIMRTFLRKINEALWFLAIQIYNLIAKNE